MKRWIILKAPIERFSSFGDKLWYVRRHLEKKHKDWVLIRIIKQKKIASRTWRMLILVKKRRYRC